MIEPKITNSSTATSPIKSIKYWKNKPIKYKSLSRTTIRSKAIRFSKNTIPLL